MSKKIYARTIIVILLSIPLFIFLFCSSYYNYYDDLGNKYDCYPFENCKFDINGNGRFDVVKVVDESTPIEKFNFRLKVFLDDVSFENEILNLKYETVDNSFRTHIGFSTENGIRKVIIYDTINKHQFFYWNGEKLLPNPTPTQLDKEIRKSLGYNDDTGGFHSKIFYPDIIAVFSFVYYILLFIFISFYLYSQKFKKLK